MEGVGVPRDNAPIILIFIISIDFLSIFRYPFFYAYLYCSILCLAAYKGS